MRGSAVETMVWSSAPRKRASSMPKSVYARSRAESVIVVEGGAWGWSGLDCDPRGLILALLTFSRFDPRSARHLQAGEQHRRRADGDGDDLPAFLAVAPGDVDAEVGGDAGDAGQGAGEAALHAGAGDGGGAPPAFDAPAVEDVEGEPV